MKFVGNHKKLEKTHKLWRLLLEIVFNCSYNKVCAFSEFFWIYCVNQEVDFLEFVKFWLTMEYKWKYRNFLKMD